jgi:hypothetical protein
MRSMGDRRNSGSSMLCRRRGLGVLVVLALLATAVVSASSWSPVEPGRSRVAEAPDELSAMAAALRQGTRVEAASLRSESANTFANPDGTWTLEQSAGPVRVRRGEGWVPVDPTLTRAADGSWVPRATSPQVSVSDGGPGAFVRIGAGDQGLGLSWPAALPAPVVSGDTATYRDVLPGVDLRVRATDQGFGHELVVRDRAAAANPALTRITFGMRAQGVRLTPDGAGNLSATDASGAVVFSAKTPTMWDSPAGAAARTERPVGVEVGAGTVTLVPDRAMLADPAVRFPVVIDPQYSYHTPNAGSSWTLLRRAFPDQSHWNLQPRDDDERYAGVARIGHAPGWPAAYLDQSVFQFDTTPVRGAVVVGATFQIYQTWKYANTCDPNAVDPMVLYRTDPIGPGTTWNHPMAWREALSSARSVPKAGYCTPDWVGMDARAGVQVSANAGASTVTLGLRANDEGGDGGWKRFYVQNGTYPKLAITYNRAPGVSDVGTEPALAACRWCGGVPYAGPTTMMLKGTVSDPDGGQVTGWWGIRKPALESRSATQAAGTRFATPLDTRTIADGTTVTWEMQGADGALNSAVVPGQKFVVDRSVPRLAPRVSAALYREDDRWHGGVGVPDTFTFAADPDTANNEANDVDHYLWGWQDPPTNKVDASGGLGGSATATLTPTGDGPRTLYVRAADRAGNQSPTKQYRFYVRGGNGALAQYAFEGNARDTAFLGDRHGTLNGPASYVPGAVGTSARFDYGGTVTAPNAMRTDTSFTVSAWVRLDQVVRDHTAVSEAGANTSAFQLGYRADDGGRWYFFMPTTDDPVPAVATTWSAQPASTGTWTHLAGVYDAGRGQMRLYVNGALSETKAYRSSWSASGDVHIGNALWNKAWANHWLGAVDEVQLYDRVVSDTELASMVRGSDVQVAYWRFDEATDSSGDPGRTARNSIDGGAAAVLTGGAAFAGNGAVKGALELDGADGAATTNAPVVRTDQSFSVAAWVKLDQAGATYTVLSQDGRNICGFCLQYQEESGRWVFVLPRSDGSPPSGFDAVVSTSAPVPGTWTHLAGVYDAAAAKVRLYVDGVLAGEQARAASWQATGPLQIGRERLNGNLGHYLDGMIDEVRVYNRAISADEVRGLVAGSDVTTGTWKLDGNAQDSSGAEHHGQLAGAPDWAAGQTSTPDPGDLALRLTGNGASMSGPHVVDTDRGFSVSAWARVDQPGRVGTVVSEDGTGTSGFVLRATAGNLWSFGMSQRDVAAAGLDEAVGTAVQAGAWTHLAGVYRSDSKQLELYVNGVLAAVKEHVLGFNATGGVQIGRSKAGEFFTGAIDDVSAYSRPLAVDEIRAMAGRDLSLVHNWQLDEAGGTGTADSVGSRSGALTGGAAFSAGRVGNAVKLDGADDAVTTTGVDLRTDTSFTVASWVYLERRECATACGYVAVSMDGGQSSKFRLGYEVDTDLDPRGHWLFEMPESDGTVTEAAVSVLPGEIGAWVHLVGVYDAPTRKIWLYVNGDRVDDGTLITPWQASGGLQIGRGKANGVATGYWPGGADEVRMYTGPFTKDRVESLYRSFPAPAAPPTLPVADAGHWRFDEGTGTTVADSSGRGLAATMRGGGGWIGGRAGYAGWFDGTSGYAETAGPAVNTGSDFSVAAWTYLTTTAGGNRTVFGQEAAGSASSSFQVVYNPDTSRWAVLAPTADPALPALLWSTETAGPGSWTHLAVVYRAEAHQLTLYVNGVLSATRFGVTLQPADGPFTIGRGKWNGSDTGYVARGVDDVRAFTKALSDGEVRRVHDDVPTAELGSWHFDNDTADDSSSRANHATLSGSGATFTQGIAGRAVQFNGVSGAATTTKNGVAMRDSFTVSAWAKLTGNQRVATVLGQDGSRTSGFTLQYRPESNHWSFGARVADSDGSASVSAEALQPARLAEWVHLAGVYDSAGRQLRLYVDGQLAATRNVGALWTATGGMSIGRGKVDGQPAEFFTGLIDEARADQGAVAAEEIARRAGWAAPPRGVLGSFVNASGDHRTASTNAPVPAGYRFEKSLGMLPAPAEPGTHPLYSCASGADEFTSPDPACEGGTPAGELGRVYADPPPGTPSTAVYRCAAGADRYDSTTDCAGSVPLGYTVAYAPLARYYSTTRVDHWSTVHGTDPSYRYEGTLGWLPQVPLDGTQPLTSCRDGGDEFTSVDPACAGKQVLAGLGYVWTAPPSGLDTTALYRCAVNGQRFVSRSDTCEGRTVEARLGYVLAESPLPDQTTERGKS